MDENLVGYLLKALETDEQREVEALVRGDLETARRVEPLRRRLDLLALDSADADPPEGLWVNTIAAVAEYKCRTLPHAPATADTHAVTPGRSWWRRVDVLVAAALLVVVAGVTTTWVLMARDREKVVACQDNLRRFYAALWAYSETRADGQFPTINAQPPADTAGFFVPLLHDARLLPDNVTIVCPADGRRPPAKYSVRELEVLRRTQEDDYNDVTRHLGGYYAYTLGYLERRDGAPHLQGLNRYMDKRLPLMADCPPRPGTGEFLAGNSPNHGGRGQNVLTIGGDVEFRVTRRAGLDDDDIFTNADGRVAAGRRSRDTVLGRSEAKPYPVPEN